MRSKKYNPRFVTSCCAIARSATRCALVLGVACAFALQPAFAQTIDAISDPWEGYNRPVFEVNQGVDALVFKPAAQIYDGTPDIVRGRITSFLNNLDDVPVMMNNVLQGDIGDAGNDLGRFVVNSSLGLVGLFDVAQHFGMEKNREDFGKTLGTWGVGQGNYLMLPLLGPSSARDFPAYIVDIFMHPATYFAPGFRAAIAVFNGLESRANLLDKEDVIRAWSTDYYAGVRNYYMSRRGLQGDTGAAPEETYEYDLDFESELFDEQLLDEQPDAQIEESTSDDERMEGADGDSAAEENGDSSTGDGNGYDVESMPPQTAASRAEFVASR